jgi:maltose O-acetyltransferase
MRQILRRIVQRILNRSPLDNLIQAGLTVGNNFHMLEEVTIDACHCWHIAIGDDVTLAPRVHILAHDASTKKLLGYTRIGKVRIGNRVFVGAGSIILPGVTIGNDVVVGAGSVVTHDVPDGTIVAGNPAKVIGSFNDFLEKRKLEMERGPCFGETYTLRGRISDQMKNDMNDKMTSGFGFVI